LFACDSNCKRVSLLIFDIVCDIVVCFRRFLFITACDQLRVRKTSTYSMKFAIRLLYCSSNAMRRVIAFSLLFLVVIHRLELLSSQFDDQSLIN
jgi:hypothetical protein